ncbi:biotin synthase BioB [Eubacterium sp. 1001713B170207_170306_E7]|uniref:biotin synthase BioB n=1 Tax=Eubacterium sp. 1001713B170207_170306_E7 TaxID=2787097 RepID=UPI00189960AF|nr:biotin synthase BioB [Eubacterium sp. 1001713B170207_170306_E7]
MKIKAFAEKIKSGHEAGKEEVLELVQALDIETLTACAADIREYFCGKDFNLCTIINGKSGRCSENCAYCAQSAHYNTYVEEYPLLPEEAVVASAISNYSQGVHRFSIVTSGKRLEDGEVDAVCRIYRRLAETIPMGLCASHGLLSYEALRELRKSGVTRYHNNLETSEKFFSKICTTHTYSEKTEVIQNALRAGLEVCSGGIIGLGESMEDRIDMVFTLKQLGVGSVPLNVLNPISGTPLENNIPLTYDEVLRTAAAFRFILPEAQLRLAGGRALFPDKGERLMKGGINAAISGDMLTTAGIATDEDIAMIKALGFEVKANV